MPISKPVAVGDVYDRAFQRAGVTCCVVVSEIMDDGRITCWADGTKVVTKNEVDFNRYISSIGHMAHTGMVKE
jgi:hypothetical protein